MNLLHRSIAATGLVAGVFTAGFLANNLLENTQQARGEQTITVAQKELATVSDPESIIFRDVAKVVSPSVVNINVHRTIRGAARGRIPDELRRFFRDHGGEDQDTPDMPGMPDDQGNMEEVGTGSGVIMEVSGNTGYIVTNNHVAGGAASMTITLADGRVIHDGKLLGADPNTDVAVVEVHAANLNAVTWGDSSAMMQGDRVMAFGSPFGYVGSMTHGIVSAMHRQAGILGRYGYEDFIQTDAPINPGNSGGPLVNSRAEVVGINTAIASESGGFQGIGFAIPSNTAKQIYQTLKSQGHITRGWLGVEISDVSKFANEAKSTGYTGDKGVLVKGVLRDSPATGKLQPGDVITKLNDKPINDVSELRTAIALAAPNTEVRLGIFRDGKEQEASVKLGQQPGGPPAVASGGGGEQREQARKLGLRLEDVNSDMVRKYGLSSNTSAGAVVVGVDPRSPAAQAGFHAGDVITQVNGKSIANAKEAVDSLSKADVKKGIRVNVINKTGTEMMFLQTGGE